MDFDGDSIKSESTLTSMSCLEDNGDAESTVCMTHASTNIPGAADIIFKISRETADRRSLSSLKLSQVAYDKIKQGHKVKFFNQYSMAYMTVRVRHTASPCREDNIMHEDEQEDGKHTDNVIPFTTKLHVGHCKEKHTRTKKARPQKQRSTVPNSLDSATLKTRYETKSLYPNSALWCREDIKNGRRLKRWGRTTQTYMDRDTNIKAACNKRKFKLPTLTDNLSNSMCFVDLVMKRVVLWFLLGLVRILD